MEHLTVSLIIFSFLLHDKLLELPFPWLNVWLICEIEYRNIENGKYEDFLFQTYKPVGELMYHSNPVTTVEWSPSDASVLASGGEDNQILQWDLGVEKDPDESSTDQNNEVTFIFYMNIILEILCNRGLCSTVTFSWQFMFCPSISEESEYLGFLETNILLKHLTMLIIDYYLEYLSWKVIDGLLFMFK